MFDGRETDSRERDKLKVGFPCFYDGFGKVESGLSGGEVVVNGQKVSTK